MKRPQKRSKPKPRTSLAEMDSVRRDEIERLEKGARYRPSPYHKLHPHHPSGGQSTYPSPRRDKTVCDGPTMDASLSPSELLSSGFRRGMVSEQKRQGWPQNVWAVDDEGAVYEAQLSNSETGEYHGYPMKVGDGFTIFIAREWEKRGT